MNLLPDKSINLVITDPPFAIDSKAMRSNYSWAQSRVLEGYTEVRKDLYYDFTVKWVREVHRLLNAPGSMYVFSGWNNRKDILVAPGRDRLHHRQPHHLEAPVRRADQAQVRYIALALSVCLQGRREAEAVPAKGVPRVVEDRGSSTLVW